MEWFSSVFSAYLLFNSSDVNRIKDSNLIIYFNL